VSEAVLTSQLKAEAARLGFVLSGVAAAATPARYADFLKWLDAGYAGQMHYLEARRDAYASPSSILDGCTTLRMLGYAYCHHEPEALASAQSPMHGQARVARYAWGTPDYHEHLFDQLQRLRQWLVRERPQARVRGVVDTAPLLEREFAAAAGLGWIGKNTLLLNRRWGSYFFLAALLTDLPLEIDPPTDKGYCGTCRACLAACPTGAFPQPYVLDARRCISYLTIEHRDAIDPDLAQHLGDWVFGCDICQEVCPWNRRVESSAYAIPEPSPDMAPVDLISLLNLDEAGFREKFRHTPLWRGKRRGVLRNACLVAGNQKFLPARAALEKLTRDPEPLIQQAAAWALQRLVQPNEQPAINRF